MAFIFGGETGASYEDIQRRRRMAQALSQSGPRRITSVGDGINSAAASIAGALMGRKAEKDHKAGQAEHDAWRDGVFGEAFGKPPMAGVSQPASVPGGATAEAIREGLVSRGFAPHVADGFIMNFQDESGLNPGINEIEPLVPGSRGGFGLAQWTGPRRVELERFAAQRGAPVSDLDTQLDFLVQELQGSESAAARSIMGSRDANSAAVAILNDFLRPAENNRARREASYLGGSAPMGSQVATGDLMKLMASPWSSQGDRAMAQALLNQQMQANDPMRRVEMETALLNLEQMRNPTTDRPTERDVNGILRYTDTGEQVFPGVEATEAAGATEYGLTPQYVTDAEGNLQMVQLSKDGTAKLVDLPEGTALQRGLEKIDMGTAFQWYNKMTGEPVGDPIAKNNREAARETAIGTTEGKAEATAVAAAPAKIEQAQSMVNLIQSVLDDPALGSVVGNFQGRLPTGIPWITGGQAGTDVGVKIRQIGGKAFMEAFESLKGGGQITEKEGQAAQDAMARLERAQSEPEYRKALRELQGIANKALLRAQGRLGMEPTETPAASGAPGTFEEFAAQPSAKAAAEKYGVTLEDMWAIQQGQK